MRPTKNVKMPKNWEEKEAKLKEEFWKSRKAKKEQEQQITDNKLKEEKITEKEEGEEEYEYIDMPSWKSIPGWLHWDQSNIVQWHK